jgi:PAS domain S-box-containing protein
MIPYLLRTVRVGVVATAVVCVAMLALFVLPSDVVIDTGLYVAVIAAAGAGAVIISLLPWESLLQQSRGMWLFYLWSALDIVLITLAIHATGGSGSPLILMYGLTTVFFAGSYPIKAQAVLVLLTYLCFALGAAVGGWQIDTGTAVALAAVLGTITYIAGFLSQELMNEKNDLEHEIVERREAERQLEEAQELAGLGSWDWNVVTNELHWSPTLYRVYGIAEEGLEPSYEGFINRVHPDDKERVRGIVGAALEDHQPFAFEHRVVTAAGEERILMGRGRVVVDESGQVVRMVGTGQDITDRKQAEENESRLRELEVRQLQALEINDEIVQGLAVAKYALDLDRTDKAGDTIERTLGSAKAMVGRLLADTRTHPGMLTRSRAARLGQESYGGAEKPEETVTDEA